MTEDFPNEYPQVAPMLEKSADGEQLAELKEIFAVEMPASTSSYSTAKEILPLPAAEITPELAVVSSSVRIAVKGLSDVGCVRTNNEDNYGFNEALGIYVVCDGMGGMASGEVASARAVAAILASYAASADSGLPVSTRLLHAINTANQDVWEFGQSPEHKGMGTTVVVAAVEDNRLILGNVGDSRAYMMQGGQCVQLTVDHSYLNELIRNGTVAIENAHSIDLRGMESVITRAIGVAAEVQPDFFSVDLHPGTAILMATDGLTRYLILGEIAAFLVNSPFEEACANLVNCAKERGGQDNITCILLRTQD